MDDEIKTLWHGIMTDPNYHIVVGIQAKKIIPSCVMIIVPNLTHGQRPYALVENVITHPRTEVKGMQHKYWTMPKIWPLITDAIKSC